MKVVQTESSLASVQYGDLYPWEPLLTFAFNFTICKLQSSSNVLKAICKIIITINQQKIITSKFQTAILCIANNVFCKMQIAIKCILQIANRNQMYFEKLQIVIKCIFIIANCDQMYFENCKL